MDEKKDTSVSFFMGVMLDSVKLFAFLYVVTSSMPYVCRLSQ